MSLGRFASKHHVTNSCAQRDRKIRRDVTACRPRTLTSSILLAARTMSTRSEKFDMLNGLALRGKVMQVNGEPEGQR